MQWDARVLADAFAPSQARKVALCSETGFWSGDQSAARSQLCWYWHPRQLLGSMEFAHGEVKVPSMKTLLLRECSRMVKTLGPYADIVCNRKIPFWVRRTTFAT